MPNPSDDKNEMFQGADQDQLAPNCAFEKLFVQYFKPLCFFCQFKFGFNGDEAKDVVHSTFLRLFESQVRFLSEASARSYLYKITSGICIDLLRRKTVELKYFKGLNVDNFHPGSSDSSDSLDFKQLQNDFQTALLELPFQMRQVFELSRNQKLKYSEIAQLLGISKKTVETQMGRALSKLRVKLSHYL